MGSRQKRKTGSPCVTPPSSSFFSSPLLPARVGPQPIGKATKPVPPPPPPLCPLFSAACSFSFSSSPFFAPQLAFDLAQPCSSFFGPPWLVIYLSSGSASCMKLGYKHMMKCLSRLWAQILDKSPKSLLSCPFWDDCLQLVATSNVRGVGLCWMGRKFI